MKITCERETLLAAFQTAATVAPSRSPKPILQNVKLVCKDSSAMLIATDMEVGIRIETSNVEVEQAGAIIVPVSKFGSILRESSAEKVRIETDGNGTLIRADRSQFRLPSLNPDEFPEVAEFTETAYHVVSARLFREMIRRTVFATDSESSRYALGGLLLEFEDGRITAVGTDGRRLAKMEGPGQSVNGHGTGETTTIVPTRSMQLIERALSDSDGEIHVCARANDILVRSPRVMIYSRLVEGRFPRWREVLPKRSGVPRINLTVGPTYAALRQAAIVASDDSRGIDFSFGNGQLMLTASTPENGEAQVEMPIDFSGEVITVRVDNRFVSDFLRVLDSEKLITVELEDSQAATLFETDDGYSYVVMPLARDQ